MGFYFRIHRPSLSGHGAKLTAVFIDSGFDFSWFYFLCFVICFVRTTVWRPSGKNRLNLISDKSFVPRMCHYIRYTFHDCFRSNGLSNICFLFFVDMHLHPIDYRRRQRACSKLFTVCSNTITVPLCHCISPHICLANTPIFCFWFYRIAYHRTSIFSRVDKF